MKRRTLMQGLGAAAATLAAPGQVRAREQTTLRYVPQVDLSYLDPHFVGAWSTRNHGHMVYDLLYGLDGNYQPSPQMAAGHTVEADGLVWNITLRPDLWWHDGEKVLARDCVASLRRWGARNAFGATLMAATQELSAPDDRTIRFQLKRPFPQLLNALALPTTPLGAMMPERLAKTDPYKQVTEIIGSGPYRYVASERVPGARNVYQKFDRYVPCSTSATGWTAGPKVVHFDRVVWTTISDPATASAALQSGEQDWWEYANPDLVSTLRRNGNVRVAITESTGVLTILRPNCLQPPFNNPEIRRALLWAIDQRDFMEAVAGDPSMYRTGHGFFCPGTPMASDAGMAPLTGPRDLAKAKRMIQEAGYNGEKATILVAADIAWVKALGDVAADVMGKAGLNVDYVSIDWGAVLARRERKEPPVQGGWSALSTGQTGIDHLLPASNNQLRATGTAPGSQPGWPDSPALEALQAKWLAAPDLASQQQICRDMQLQAMHDVPYYPLGQYLQATAYRSDIENVNTGFSTFWNVRRRA